MAEIYFPDGTKLSNLKYGIQICTSATRPASPSEGWHIYETDTDKLYYWSGAAWVERTGGGVTDHGALTGLADDDHTQYLLASGARLLAGDLDFNGYRGKQIVYLDSPDSVSLDLRYGTTSPSTKFRIGTGLTAYADIAMSANKLTNVLAIQGGANANIELKSGTTSGNYIDINSYGEIKLRANSGYYSTQEGAGIQPISDNVQNCGNASKRWALVRGVTVTSGDIAFEEKVCTICKEPFKVGEILCMQVVEVGDVDAPTRCVPVHKHHEHGDKNDWVKPEKNKGELEEKKEGD